eukprot:3469653-Pleurochrysis_carterae.AAC.6
MGVSRTLSDDCASLWRVLVGGLCKCARVPVRVCAWVRCGCTSDTCPCVYVCMRPCACIYAYAYDCV